MRVCPFVGPMVVSSPGIRFPFRLAPATGARVARAFARAVDDHDASILAELRAATVAFAAALKAEGRSPDEALISLKRAIHRNGWWPSLVPPRLASWEQQPAEFQMYLRVFRWFLEGFFGAMG